MQYLMEACLAYAVLFLLIGAAGVVCLPVRWVLRRMRQKKEETR